MALRAPLPGERCLLHLPMALRSLLLAWCAYAWTAVAWAPPRRHLAPLPKPRLAAADETEVPKNVPEDAPLELTNKILRGMRSFPALVGAGALSWLAPPTLVGTAFFLTGGTDLSRDVLKLSLIHKLRCRPIERCRSRRSPYH